MKGNDIEIKYRENRGWQLNIENTIIEATNKTKHAKHARHAFVNVSEHAAATAAKSAVTSYCEHIYNRSYATILKNRTLK